MKVVDIEARIERDKAVKDLMLYLNAEIEKAFLIPPNAPIHNREWMADYQRRMLEETRPLRRTQAYLSENFAWPVMYRAPKWPDLMDDNGS